jgi:hypothetical protein
MDSAQSRLAIGFFTCCTFFQTRSFFMVEIGCNFYASLLLFILQLQLILILLASLVYFT